MVHNPTTPIWLELLKWQLRIFNQILLRCRVKLANVSQKLREIGDKGRG